MSEEPEDAEYYPRKKPKYYRGNEIPDFEFAENKREWFAEIDKIEDAKQSEEQAKTEKLAKKRDERHKSIEIFEVIAKPLHKKFETIMQNLNELHTKGLELEQAIINFFVV